MFLRLVLRCKLSVLTFYLKAVMSLVVFRLQSSTYSGMKFLCSLFIAGAACFDVAAAIHPRSSSAPPIRVFRLPELTIAKRTRGCSCLGLAAGKVPTCQNQWHPLMTRCSSNGMCQGMYGRVGSTEPTCRFCASGSTADHNVSFLCGSISIQQGSQITDAACGSSGP